MSTSSPTLNSSSNGSSVYIFFLLPAGASLLGLIFIYRCCIDNGLPYRRHVVTTTTRTLLNITAAITTTRLEEEQLQEIDEFSYSRMPTEDVDKRTDEEDGIQKECSICLAPFEAGEICRELPPPCGHIFHKKCVDRWFEKSVKCPLCSRSIDAILNEKKLLQDELNKLVTTEAVTLRI